MVVKILIPRVAHLLGVILVLLLLLGRPPCPHSMLIIGWWYFVPDTGALGYVPLLCQVATLLRPALIPIPSFLPAPFPSLSPTPPLLSPSPQSDPSLSDPTTVKTPMIPASKQTVHIGP